MGLLDWFGKKQLTEIQQRREYVRNRKFCQRFTDELKRFHPLENLQVNPYIPKEADSYEVSDAIPLLLFTNESVGTQPYEEFLAENESKIWENILLDDSMISIHIQPLTQRYYLRV